MRNPYIFEKMFGILVFLTYSIFVQNVDSSPISDGSQSDLVGDKANRMCKAYAKYGLEKDTNSCASKKENLNSSDAIVGIASRKEFPHMVHLCINDEEDCSWACGGTLISDRFILTAAHCTSRKYLAKLVRAGITNVNDKNNLQIRNVTRIIVHPDYNTGAVYNDIALLKVDSPFEINSYVRPACVHTEKNIPSKNGIATGWGITSFAGKTSEDLKRIKLEILDSAKCDKTYRRDINQPGSRLPNGFLDDSLICAGSENLNTCSGDAGGPFQIYHEDTEDIKCMYSTVGIISFGKSCGLIKNTPDGFTRVFPYIKWIEDNVWP